MSLTLFHIHNVGWMDVVLKKTRCGVEDVNCCGVDVEMYTLYVVRTGLVNIVLTAYTISLRFL